MILLRLNKTISLYIGWWTLDNATNNDTFMAELEKVLHAKGISFSSTENHIQ
jgi:hypothetical protein